MSKRVGIVMILVTGLILITTFGVLSAGISRPNSYQLQGDRAPGVAVASPTPYFYLDPQVLNLRPGDVTELTVRTSHVDDLGGVNIHLRWDPSLIRVVDTNPLVEGVQVLDGNVFEGSSSYRPPGSGNSVDNGTGELSYARVLVGSSGVSGEFSVAIIPVQALAIGSCDAEFFGETMMTSLSTGDIRSGAVNGEIVVSETIEPPTATLTPTPEETLPVPTETRTPTNTPTAAPIENGLFLPIVFRDAPA